MNFDGLQRRLVERLRDLIQSGTLTERGLARKTGISQPHIHNVLKGVRYFSIETSDQIMRELRISIDDLCASNAPQPSAAIQLIPMLYPEISTRCRAFPKAGETLYPLPFVWPSGTEHLYACRLGDDPAIGASFRRGDIVILDCSPLVRANPWAGGPFVIERNDCVMVRYLRAEQGVLFIYTQEHPEPEVSCDSVNLDGRNVTEIVRAKVVWVGRNLPVNRTLPVYRKAG